MLDTLHPLLVEKAEPPVDPAAARCQLAPVQETEGEPERASSSALDVPRVCPLVVPTRPVLFGLLGTSDQVGGHGKPLEVLDLQRSVGRGGEMGVGVLPRVPVERCATFRDVAHVHTLAQAASYVGSRSALGPSSEERLAA